MIELIVCIILLTLLYLCSIVYSIGKSIDSSYTDLSYAYIESVNGKILVDDLDLVEENSDVYLISGNRFDKTKFWKGLIVNLFFYTIFYISFTILFFKIL